LFPFWDELVTLVLCGSTFFFVSFPSRVKPLLWGEGFVSLAFGVHRAATGSVFDNLHAQVLAIRAAIPTKR